MNGKFRGLHLWIDDFDHDIQYQMRIWRNFQGVTYRKLVHDKVTETQAMRYPVSSWDYATAFVLLRSHFGIS